MPKKIAKGKSEAFDDTDPIASLHAKLKAADQEIQLYVAALKAENLKCARKVAKLQAKNFSAESRILALTEDLEKKNKRIHDIETLPLDPDLQKMINGT